DLPASHLGDESVGAAAWFAGHTVAVGRVDKFSQPPPDGTLPLALAPVAGASCDDRTTDGDESDVDCGGATCPPCAANHYCRVAADCCSGYCIADHCVKSCDNGFVDGA